VASSPPKMGPRPCCMLTPVDLPHPGGGVGVADPSKLGAHSYKAGDVYGQIYTCRGGFIDLGHTRETADLTRYFYHYLSKGGLHSAGSTFPTYGYKGSVHIKADIAGAQRVSVAASIAYDWSVFHEIESYYNPDVGGHHSSFSPEDSVSNFLGTYIGERALSSPGSYDANVTSELDTALKALGAQPPVVTNAVFAKISPSWIAGLDLMDLYSFDYLKRRNFDLYPVDPWIVPGIAQCPDTTWPVAIPRSHDPAIRALYEVEFDVPVHASAKLGAKLNTAGYAGAVTTIKADALAAYGANFATP